MIRLARTDILVAGPVGAISVLALIAGTNLALAGPAVAFVVCLVLACLPTVPLDRSTAVRTVVERSFAIVVGAAGGQFAAGHIWSLTITVGLLTVLGSSRTAVGPAAPLAAILIPAIGIGDTGSVALAGVTATSLATVLAAAVRPKPGTTSMQPLRPERGPLGRVVLGFSVAAITALALLLEPVVGGAHWLCTSFLLTSQASTRATAQRWGHRVLGNSMGAGIAAFVLALQFAAPVRALFGGVLIAIALGMRRRAYLSWAIAAPPALLIFTEFTQQVDALAGIQRVGLNIVGGGIALALTAFADRLPR